MSNKVETCCKCGGKSEVKILAVAVRDGVRWSTSARETRQGWKEYRVKEWNHRRFRGALCAQCRAALKMAAQDSTKSPDSDLAWRSFFRKNFAHCMMEVHPKKRAIFVGRRDAPKMDLTNNLTKQQIAARMKQRTAYIKERRRQGATLGTIAKELGISRARVSQLARQSA